MKIKFEKNAEQLELIKAMGSEKSVESMNAQETFASLIAPVIGEAFNQADTTSLVYKELTVNQDEDPSFPLEIFSEADPTDEYFTVWSQTFGGGLPTNHVYHPVEEVKFQMYRLDSAISYYRKYARKARIDVVSKALERLMQEVMLKAQNNAWSVVLAALANASVNGESQVYKTRTANSLTLDDFNDLLTHFRRLNRSFAGGTPVGGISKPTDMIVSPEIMAQLREFAYNPINTKGANKITAAADSSGVELPEADRAALLKSGGAPEFFGINLIELLELGSSQAYNALFAEYASGKTFTEFDASNGGSFSNSADELIIVLDASKDFAWKAKEVGGEGQSFTLLPDDSIPARSDKIGMYGYVSEGRIITSTRPIMGLIV
jgi:hypothetical protein